MLLAISICAFALAFALFVYLFDHYMGASDTEQLAHTMAHMHEPKEFTRTELKRSKAAFGT